MRVNKNLMRYVRVLKIQKNFINSAESLEEESKVFPSFYL